MFFGDEVMIKQVKETKKTTRNDNGELHSFNDEPSSITYRGNKIESMAWHKNGVLHRIGKPALVCYDFKETLSNITYYHEGVLHREDGPALIYYDFNGMIEEQQWVLHGLSQSINHKPAKIKYHNGIAYQVSYHNKSLVHRVNYPAILTFDRKGVLILAQWYEKSERTNTLNTPAHVEYNEETRGLTNVTYYFKDKPHRVNGPASIGWDPQGNLLYEKFFAIPKYYSTRKEWLESNPVQEYYRGLMNKSNTANNISL